ncbi:MAG: ABC transporter permease [Bryobacteraceae bacterium]|nr:ABC transporter permease [Bryobacteraceae bacterium]
MLTRPWSDALRRVASATILLMALAAICFALFALVPGDSLTDAAIDPGVSPDAVAAMRQRLAADWTHSRIDGRPVAEAILPRAARTLSLSLASLLSAWLLAVPYACRRTLRRSALDTAAGGAAVGLLVAAPDLLLALGGLWLAVESEWFRTSGDFLLGWIVLTLVLLPALVRHAQSALAEAALQPFVAAARMAGIPDDRLAALWLLPASSGPLIALLGLGFATTLSASLIVETVLGWPGLGPLLLEAILARDYPVILGAVLLSGAFAIGGNLAADLLQLAVDPRRRSAA